MKIWYVFLFMTYSITPMSSSSSGSEMDLEAQKQLAKISSYSDSDLFKVKPDKGKHLGPSLSRSASSPELSELTQLQNMACAIVLDSTQDAPTVTKILNNKIKQMHTSDDSMIGQIEQLSENESKKQELGQLVERLFAQTLQDHQIIQQKKIKQAKIWSVATVGIAVIPVIMALLQLFVIIGVGVGCNT